MAFEDEDPSVHCGLIPSSHQDGCVVLGACGMDSAQFVGPGNLLHGHYLVQPSVLVGCWNPKQLVPNGKTSKNHFLGRDHGSLKPLRLTDKDRGRVQHWFEQLAGLPHHFHPTPILFQTFQATPMGIRKF